MRYNLVDGSNASRRHSQLLPGRSIPLAGYSLNAQTGFLLCPLRFAMAALKSKQIAQSAFPYQPTIRQQQTL